MKLQEYALMAEIVGGLAIVLSLGIVGFELRQSNQTNIQTATQGGDGYRNPLEVRDGEVPVDLLARLAAKSPQSPHSAANA